MKKNIILKLSLLAIFFLTYTLPAWADLDNPDNSDDPAYEETPIDSWQMLLVMAAVVAGIYFMVKHRKSIQG